MTNRPVLSSRQTRYIRTGSVYICQNKGCGGKLEVGKSLYYLYCPYCGRRIEAFYEEP